MRRTAILAILLALLMLLAACGGSGGKQNNNDDGPSDGPSSDLPDGSTEGGENEGSEEGSSQDGNDAVQVTKDAGGTLTVEFLIPAAAEKEVSVLVLSDKAAADTWQSNPDQVLAIDQLTADASGKGSVTLTPKQSSAYVVVVSYAGGREIAALQ